MVYTVHATSAMSPQECWCKDKPDHGSFFCCQNCPAKDGPAVHYHLEYVVTYRCTLASTRCPTSVLLLFM